MDQSVPQLSKNQIRALIAKCRVPEVLQFLQSNQAIFDVDTRIEIYTLAYQFNFIDQKTRKGAISWREELNEKTLLVNRLIRIIEHAMGF